MQHAFTSAYKELQDLVYEETVLRGYFPARPDKVRTQYFAIGIASVIGGVAVAVAWGSTLSVLLGIEMKLF